MERHPALFLRLLQRDVHALADRLNRSPPVCECSFITTPSGFEIGDRAASMIVRPVFTAE